MFAIDLPSDLLPSTATQDFVRVSNTERPVKISLAGSGAVAGQYVRVLSVGRYLGLISTAITWITGAPQGFRRP